MFGVGSYAAFSQKQKEHQHLPGGVADDTIEISSDSDEEIETDIDIVPASASKRKWKEPEAAVIAPVTDDWFTAAVKKKKPTLKKSAAKKKKKRTTKAAAVAAAAANTKKLTSFVGQNKIWTVCVCWIDSWGNKLKEYIKFECIILS